MYSHHGFLVPLALTGAASETEAAIQKKIFGLGHPPDFGSRTTTLVF